MKFGKVKAYSYGEEKKDIQQCDGHAELSFFRLRDILSSLYYQYNFTVV